jgi:hypothetical protein
MNLDLLFDNNFTYYGTLIGFGVILGFSYYYLISSNTIAIPINNIEALTNQEIENIVNENAATITNKEHIDSIIYTDSDSETEVQSDNQSLFASDSDSSSAFENILNPDIFFMPDVDFNICPLNELKFFEFSALYAREIVEHNISDEEIMEFIS